MLLISLESADSPFCFVEEDIPSLSCCCGHNANLLLQKLQKEIRWMKDTLSWWRVPRLYLGAHEPTNEGTERATKLLLHSTSMIMKKIVQNCNFSRCGPLAFSFHENFYSVYTRRCDFWSSSSSHTVFENHRKSLIQHCERSQLRLRFEWTKVN